MRTPSTHVFSLDGGAAELTGAFDRVEVVRPRRAGVAHITDPTVVADYVASIADHYQTEITEPWEDIVDEVRRRVSARIERDGAFLVSGDVGAFVCR